MKISVLGTRGFPKIQGGVEKHCESLYPLFNAKYQITVYRRKPYVNSDKTYPNIKFIDLPSTKTLNPQLHSRSATYIKRNGLLIRKITIKSSRPFQCAYHPLTP